MARLIDANKFGMYLADVQLANRGWKEDVCYILDGVMDALDKQTTIDAVEVVRCKDCQWYGPNHDGNWVGCAFDTRNLEDIPKDDDFCSMVKGELKMDNDFPSRLRKLRERRGMNRKALGERCGLSKNIVGQYERGEKEPVLSTAVKLAEIFDTSVDFLAGLTEYKGKFTNN